jgi:hypothetical protein
LYAEKIAVYDYWMYFLSLTSYIPLQFQRKRRAKRSALGTGSSEGAKQTVLGASSPEGAKRSVLGASSTEGAKRSVLGASSPEGLFLCNSRG